MICIQIQRVYHINFNIVVYSYRTTSMDNQYSKYYIRHVQNLIINDNKGEKTGTGISKPSLEAKTKGRERVYRIDKKGNITNLNKDADQNDGEELINFLKMLSNTSQDENQHSPIDNKDTKCRNDTTTKKLFNVKTNAPIDELEIEQYNIATLIKLGELYNKEDYANKNYSINIKGLHDMTPVLLELDSLIGMHSIKQQIVEQIMFLCQDIYDIPIGLDKLDYSPSSKETDLLSSLFVKKNSSKPQSIQEYSLSSSCINDDANGDMFHTVIQGGPGTGKTILGKILAKIYLSLGITTKDTFKVVRRSDMIGEYLGHTSIKTQHVIDEAMGGVLFIDEAYTLGNTSTNDKSDSYAKECLDTLNHNLTVNKGRFVCIIAGYQKELEENFFTMNPGLKRRFSFSYTIDEYTAEDMIQIFIHMINRANWHLTSNAQLWMEKCNFFVQHKNYFEYYGGDIETFFLHCKIAHAKRVFGKNIDIHKILTVHDLEQGFEHFKQKKNIEPKYICNIYS